MLPQGDVDEDGAALTVPLAQLRFDTNQRGGGDPSQVVQDGFTRLEGGSGSGGGGGGSPGGPRIVADPRTNSIMVYSTYSIYRRMQEVLQALDVPQSQVVIEATVIEVDLTDQLQSGVQFLLESSGVTVGSSGNTVPTEGAAGGYIGISTSLGNLDVEAVLGALGSVTRVKVISSPYLTVMDGRSARLVIGDQIPFQTREQTSSNTGGVTVTEDVELLDTGIILEVTPRIHSTNAVDLTINQSVTTPSESIREGDRTPIIATRNIQSQILGQSGRTILLGGLIQDRLERGRSGVPGLSDVPVVGGLFRSDTDRIRRVELLVMITPRVIRSSSQIEDLTRMLRSEFHTSPFGSTADYGGPSKPEE
jgi:general secretion pathway protein D